MFIFVHYKSHRWISTGIPAEIHRKSTGMKYRNLLSLHRLSIDQCVRTNDLDSIAV